MLNSNKLLRENFILYSKRNNNNNAPELFSSSTHRENCCSCILLVFSKGMNWLMGGLLVWGAVVLSAWGAGARMRRTCR